MQIFGRTELRDFLGDLIVYRNLVPIDKRLPALNTIRTEISLSSRRIPRKTDKDYAHVVVHLLNQARALVMPGTPIERLIFIGDTRMNDGTAFTNLCAAGGWDGMGFVGSETSAPTQIDVVTTSGGGQLYISNRWETLPDFDSFCASQGCPVDDKTAVIIDLDKTALGARGRNSHAIDQARVEAIRNTVAGLLDAAFDQIAFQAIYDKINQVEFHPFTTDNQDYLAYLCLIISGGLHELDEVVADIRAQRLTCFHDFIEQVNTYRHNLPSGLDPIHSEIYANVQSGDPTPFKAFRYNEYLSTVERMGKLGEDASVEELLAEEIVITQEVRALALDWRKRGALLFGLSDKPDEASVPRPSLAARGYLPIHHVATWTVGSQS